MMVRFRSSSHLELYHSAGGRLERQIINGCRMKLDEFTFSKPSTGRMRGGGSIGGGSRCNEGNGGPDCQNERKNCYRHTPEQIQRMEAYYHECPRPDKNQRRELAVELGLEPRQIKFWFQNKRIQTKMQNEQEENNVLRAENDRIRRENIAIQEVLKKMSCPSCIILPLCEEERKQSLEKLHRENLELRQEIGRVSNILANYMGRPLLVTFDQPNASPAVQGSGSCALEVDSVSGMINIDNSHMTGVAASAMDELITLMRSDKPLWIWSLIDNRFVLDRDNYLKLIPQSKGLRFLKSRKESSKDTGLINMDARSLVNLYLDTDEWVHHFPTAVSKTRTIHVLEPGFPGTRSGFLQLIYEQMHILSLMTRPQEFYVLRYCQQIETGVWVIADVSCDLSGSCRVPPTSCWKHPSGCRIEDLSNGLSKVTFIEHLEVDDGFLVHPVHEELVKNVFRFGAKRWIMTFQITCDHYLYLSKGGRYGREVGRGTRSMIMLGRRIIRSFCSIFSFLGSTDLPQLLELTKDGVQVALRKSTCSGHPIGIVILAASSFRVPASPQRVCKYLSDHKLRSQWDILCYGGRVYEIGQTPTGRNPVNHISILQALNPRENIIFQETTIHDSGSLVVYAPIHASIAGDLVAGEDSSSTPILASGFAINGEWPGERASTSTSTGNPLSGGSTVTVGFQFLACTSLSMEDVGVNMLPNARTFVNRTVNSIKAAFGC